MLRIGMTLARSDRGNSAAGARRVSKSFSSCRVLLHDLSEQELIDGLQNGRLELAIMREGRNRTFFNAITG